MRIKFETKKDQSLNDCTFFDPSWSFVGLPIVNRLKTSIDEKESWNFVRPEKWIRDFDSKFRVVKGMKLRSASEEAPLLMNEYHAIDDKIELFATNCSHKTRKFCGIHILLRWILAPPARKMMPPALPRVDSSFGPFTTQIEHEWIFSITKTNIWFEILPRVECYSANVPDDTER